MSLMNEAFKEYLDKFVFVYLDDILIYSETWEDNLEHLRKALEILRKEKLFAKLLKCTFGAQEVEYLDSSSDQMEWQLTPTRTKPYKKWPIPKSKKTYSLS